MIERSPEWALTRRGTRAMTHSSTSVARVLAIRDWYIAAEIRRNMSSFAALTMTMTTLE
jgi:hypothetical protein